MIYRKNHFTTFYYHSTPEEVSSELNETYPTKLKFNEDLVRRVAIRYPLIKKSEVALIISKTIESIREFLVMGDTINIVRTFTNFKLSFFQRPYQGDIYSTVKLKISTPERLKNAKS